MMSKKQKLELTWADKEKRHRMGLHIWLEGRMNLHLAQAHRLSLSGRHNWKRIHQGLAGPVRLAQLNAIAITQMRSLVGIGTLKQLGDKSASKRNKP